MLVRVSKYTMGIIIAVAFSLFILGLMIMSAVYLAAYVRTI